MNIDIINKQVSKELGIDEKKVAIINKFYWRKAYDHFYDYNERPLNIEYVCVFHPDKWLVRKTILKYILKIRKTLKSTKFKEGSIKQQRYIESYKKMIRDLWKIRKLNKYTN
jgi:hypothetical protein